MMKMQIVRCAKRIQMGAGIDKQVGEGLGGRVKMLQIVWCGVGFYEDEHLIRKLKNEK